MALSTALVADACWQRLKFASQPRPWVLYPFKISEQLHKCTISTFATAAPPAAGYAVLAARGCRQCPQICITNPDPWGSWRLQLHNCTVFTSATAVSKTGGGARACRQRPQIEAVDRRALSSARNNTTVGDCKPGESEVGWYRKIIFRYCPDRKLNLFWCFFKTNKIRIKLIESGWYQSELI